MTQSGFPPLRAAATAMLLREHNGAIEVLVVRRHEKLAFMGGMWVFPGGALCPADSSAAALARIVGSSPVGRARLATLQGTALEHSLGLGLAVTTHRETFEETGILLARAEQGGHLHHDGLLAQLQERRSEIAAQPALFARLLQEADLFLDLDRLIYWAHWITPSALARRFDTRFFLIAVPSGQSVAVDATETVDHAWLEPAALIAAAAAGTMPVSPPTLYNVMELHRSLRAHRSLQIFLTDAARRHVVPILPKIVREEPGERAVMVLPWDPFYRKLVGESAPDDLEYARAQRELPSRMVLTPRGSGT